MASECASSTLALKWRVVDVTLSTHEKDVTRVLTPFDVPSHYHPRECLGQELVQQMYGISHYTNAYRCLRPQSNLNEASYGEFAAIETEADVIRFASRYGLLCGLDITVFWWPPEVCDIVFPGEPIERWLYFARRMREVVSLWERHKRGDSDTVKGVKGPITISELLANGISLGLWGLVSLEVNADAPDYRSLSRSVVPNCLLGALWLQLLDEVMLVERNGLCIVCGRSFSRVRKTKQFCSSRCKSLYRQQRRVATNEQ